MCKRIYLPHTDPNQQQNFRITIHTTSEKKIISHASRKPGGRELNKHLIQQITKFSYDKYDGSIRASLIKRTKKG